MNNECRWVWEERRERGFWRRLLFWRRPSLAPDDDGAWVPRRGRVEEHAEILAANDRERGW